MTRTPFSPSVRRRTVEPVLAALTVTLAVVWVTEPGFVFDGGIVAAIVGPLFVPATLLVPGLLAASVLARVVRHGVRLAATYADSSDRTQNGATSLRRIGTSLVFGALAGYTLWWVVASVSVLTVDDAGGVMLAPLVALVTGSVLGVLLLGQTVR
ncbi:hypothetical protein [Halorubrum sp. DTA98]|uniref:hypothetical protein n=1 Tax=Halorubrum sp. DTA98 TaxID=3402163 RepID=UPI003AB0ABC7